jgi:hypothetical protein
MDRMKKPITFFDQPENIRRLTLGFFIALGGLLSAEWFVAAHPHFEWEAMPFFSAAYGFVACVGVIFTAKGLRWMLGRPETYYEEDDGAEGVKHTGPSKKPEAH